MERSSRRTLWPLLRLFRLTWPLAVFFLVTTYQYSGSHASQADDRKKIVTVDNRHGNPSAADYTDILLAVNAATDNATIGLQEGVYVVDNPVVLNRAGVRIKGQGREKTIIRPRNAGKAIFKFKANNLSISDQPC